MAVWKGSVDVAERERILVLVRGHRDGELTRQLLSRANLDAHVCASIEELCGEIRRGAAATLLRESALTNGALEAIRAVLADQPVWLDLPVIVFSSGESEQVGLRRDIQQLGNVTFLDRPVQVRSMLAAVKAAVRSRKRQYETGRAIESRDAFLAMLGHELRNPLGAIRLATTLLQAKEPEAARSKELGVIERQSVHLSRLVDELLDVARVTQGKIVLRRERLSLVSAVRNAYELMKPTATDHLATFDFIAEENDEIAIDGDRHRLEQVFTNLLTNAIKYTPHGGTVAVRITSEGDHAIVTVSDTGVGLDADMRERVFDVFAQAERTLDRAQGGIGVGLALVRGLVELHGGTIHAESDGLGKGSSFVLTLPRATLGTRPPKLRPSTSVELSIPTKRIVVVEDNADMRELLISLLAESGHTVTCAETGREGLDLILATTPDVALVDIGLPQLDGLEVARRVRAANSTVRLIAMTGYGQRDDKTRALAAGFDAHLTKPVELVDLMRELSREAG